MSDVAFIEVEGERITEWTEYSVDSDLMTPADGFSFTVAIPKEDARRRAELRAVLFAGAEAKLFVGDDVGGGPTSRYQQMVGVIDDVRVQADRDGGTLLEIEGRDLAGILTDSSVSLTLDVRSNMRLVDLVRAAVDPYGIRVVTDSFAAQRTLQAGRRRNEGDAARRAGVHPSEYSLTAQAEADRTGRPIDEVAGNPLSTAIRNIQVRRAARSGYANVMGPGDIDRLTIRDARPQVGETVWAFCARHAERLGVLMWFSPFGRLVLSSPRYQQEPRYRAVRRYDSDPNDPNTILGGGLVESIGDRHSEVVVYGRGNPRSSDRQPVTGTATDDAWPSSYAKPLYMQESSIRTGDQAARKALRQLMLGKKDAFRLDYTLPDHGQSGYLYAIDSTITVIDEPADVEGTFYITKRTFRKGRESGTTTDVRCVPRGSLVY